MKKVLVLLVAITMLVSGSAFAQIAGSAHDLSSGGPGPASASSDEVCVFCHTPHNAAALGFAPLWNRGAANAVEVYSGTATLNATITAATVNATDAPLCLSCHDGVSITGLLNNPPNAAPGAGPDIAGSMAASTNLDTDLSNDHPIGFNYTTVAGIDAEIDTAAQAVIEGAEFYGAGGTDMWCSSCHDVHDDTITPFLKTSNAASALCTACHIK